MARKDGSGFKMKANGEGPFKKNFPSAFKLGPMEFFRKRRPKKSGQQFNYSEAWHPDREGEGDPELKRGGGLSPAATSMG